MEAENEELPIIEITDYNDLDVTMGALRTQLSELAHFEAFYDTKIQAMQDVKRSNCAPIAAQIDQFKRSIRAFLLSRVRDFVKRRSRKLTHGTVGFRMGTGKVVIKDHDATLAALRGDRKLKKCVRIVYGISKSAVAKLAPEVQAAVGVEIVKEEHVFFELVGCDIVTYNIPAEDLAAS